MAWLLTNAMCFFINLVIFSILFYIISGSLKRHFNLPGFTVYYLFYQPLAFFTLIVGILTPFFSSKYELDWKA